MIQAITNNQFQNSFSVKNEFSRILSAAVINCHFRQLLLNDPVKAITNGYSGEQFEISNEEKSRLSTIKASSLADFATQLSSI